MGSPQLTSRLRVPVSLLPRALMAALIIGIMWQLSWSSGISIEKKAPSRPAADSLGGSDPQTDWFEDAKKAGQIEDDEQTPPQYFADKPTSAAPQSSPTPSMPSGHVDYSKIHRTYGTANCLPPFTDKMKAAALERNRSCERYAPFPSRETRRTGFASISTGETAEAYQRAIQSQMFASAVKGSSFHILCEELSDGAWNKIAFLLHLVMNEMLKPVAERLEWILWIDRDAILLDPCRPLSSFLPPNTSDYDSINLIYNQDAFALNAGVFLFRVSSWSIDLFNTILAFRYYRPDEELILAEQTALDKIIHEEKYKDSTARVPWYWFNAYPDEEESVEKYSKGLEPENLEWFRARKGDYVVHFAGDDGRGGRMPAWLDMLEQIGNVYEKKEQQRDVSKEVEKYWKSWKEGTLKEDQLSGETWKEIHVDKKNRDDDRA